MEIFGKDHLTPTLNKVQSRLAAFGKFTSAIGGSALRAGSMLLAPVAALFAGTLAKSKEGVFGPQAQAHAQAFTDAWGRAILSLQRGLVPVLQFITPIMESFSNIAAKNEGLVAVVAGLAVGLLAFGAAAKAVGAAFTIASLAIGAVKLVIMALASPVLLVVGGIIGLIAAFTDWRGLFGKLADTGKKAIGGVIAAFRSGQLELAGKIALAGLKLAWHDVVKFMKDELGGIIGIIGDIAKMVVVLKAAQAGASIGSVFGPLGTIIGGAAGAGLGVAAIREIDKAVKHLMAGIGGSNREQLEKELADLLKQVNPVTGPEAPQRVMAIAAEAVRGLFQSPNFARALGVGPGARVNEGILEEAKKQVALLGDIKEELRRGGVFA